MEVHGPDAQGWNVEKSLLQHVLYFLGSALPAHARGQNQALLLGRRPENTEIRQIILDGRLQQIIQGFVLDDPVSNIQSQPSADIGDNTDGYD